MKTPESPLPQEPMNGSAVTIGELLQNPKKLAEIQKKMRARSPDLLISNSVESLLADPLIRQDIVESVQQEIKNRVK